MICRRCGNRIPEYLISREYFQCPECGRQFGNPPAESDRRGYQPRYDRAESGYERRSARYEPEYDDSPADDRYYDDGQGYYEDDGYYDDQAYEDDGYYDDQYYDDPAYDDGYYDDGRDYYDDSQDYSDDFVDFDRPAPRKARPKRTMKLAALLYVLIVEVVALIVIACIGAGLSSGEPEKAAPTDAPAAVTVTADPNATESPYPVV